jgi:hypothetical protein
MVALMPMAISLISLLPALIAAVVVTVILLFLPAAIELKKPKDAGPRQITTNIPRLMPIHMSAIELESKPGDYAVAGAIFLSAIPNIEKF